MNKIITCFFVMIASLSLHAQHVNKYNKALADSLHADDYGMKMYTLVILKTGNVAVKDSAQRAKLFSGHMQNINRLADSGKLIVAGPLQENDKNYEGIFFINAGSKKEAEALLSTDPAIAARVLDVELYQWYGSAALPMYMPYHEQVQKKSF